MATGSTRDVKMVLSVESLGQENITKLQQALRDLATTGGAGTAEFAELADQIGRLGDQGAALQSFKALTVETEALREKQQAAGAQAETLSAKLDLARNAADLVKTSQAAARQELLAGERAYTEAGNALRALKAEYDNAGKQTAAYRSRLQELVAQQNTARTALIDLREANKLATASVTSAVAEQGKAEGAYKRAAIQADAASQAASRQAVALKQSGDAAKELGVEVGDLAQAEAELLGVFARGTTALTERRQAVVEMAEADRLAKIEAQGLAEIYRKGEAALQAETLAQRDAERATLAYAAAKDKATADAAQWQQEADEIVALVEAQRRLQTITQRTVEQLQELAAVDAFEKQAREAQRLVQAAQYVQFWEQALTEADRKQQELAANTRLVNDALNTLNVRPVEAVRDEITQTEAAMRTLADQGQLTGGALAVAMDRGQQKINGLQREVRELTGALTLADRAAGLLKNSMGQISVGNLVADGIGYLVEKVKEMGRAFIDVTVETERTRKGLEAIYKNAAVATGQFDFLRTAATDAGVSVGAINGAFLRFSAALHGSNQSLETTNSLFAAVTRAGATLGLTGEQVSGALDALGQIASKGTLSLEELRQQLGDRIPGALSLTAKGLGVTEAQLIKLIEAGQVSARDFFPAFTASLKDVQGSTDTLARAWGRFVNLLRQSAVSVGDAGGLTLLKSGLAAVGSVLGVVVIAMQGFIEVVGLNIVAVKSLYTALSGDGTKAWNDFNNAVLESGNRLGKLNDSFAAMFRNQGAATDATNASAAAMVQGSAAAISYAAAQLQVAGAETAVGNALIQRLVKAKEDAVASASAVVASEKLLKAKTDEGRAMVAAAERTGNATKALTVNAQVSASLVVASDQVQAARQRELDVVMRSIDAYNQERDAQGKLTADRQAGLDKLNQQKAVLEASVEQTRQSTAELQQQAQAAILAAEAYADNSTQIDAYRQAMESSREESESLTRSVETQTLMMQELAARLAEGSISQKDYDAAAARLLITKQALAAATNQGARSEALFRDALSDSIAKIELATRAKSADLSVTQAGVAAEQRRYESLAAAARARGDETAATYYSIEAKQREIEQIKLSVQIKTLEIEASRQSIAIQRQELDVADPLYAQKAKELDIRLKLLQVQEIENKSKLDAINAIQTEINNLRIYGDEKGRSTEKTKADTKATDENTNAKQRNARASETQAEAERKRLNVDKEGFSLDKSGGRLVAGGDLTTLTGISAFLKSAGVDDVNTKRIATEFSDGRGNIPYYQNPGQQKYGGKYDTISAALLKAAERVTFGGAAVGGRPAGVGSTDTAAAAEDKKPGGREGTNVTVNIGGQRRTIGVGSQSDANALVSVLRDLENQSGTAT